MPRFADFGAREKVVTTVHTFSGRSLGLALAAFALGTVGCSSGDDSFGTSADSGGSDDSAAPATDDAGGNVTLDATIPATDAGHDGAAPIDAPSGQDSPSDTDAKDSHDSGSLDAGSDAPTADDAGQDAGNPAALPAALAIWEFQDTPGSTTAVDSSGNGHDAKLQGSAAIVAGAGAGPALPPDAGGDDSGADDASAHDAAAADASAPDASLVSYGNYLQIDGTSGAFADVTGGALFDDSKSFTVATWVSFPSFNYNYDELISADGAHASVFELQLAPLTLADGGGSYNAEAAFPTTDVPTPGAYYYAFSSTQPQTAVWYHVAGVYDMTSTPGLVSLYVNGALQSNAGDSRQTAAPPVAAVGDFIIGAGKYNDTRTTGAVANYMGVRVYGQALTAPQVAALYGMGGL